MICHKCRGRGTVPDWFFRVFTLGLGMIGGEDEQARQTCPVCKGKGKLN